MVNEIKKIESKLWEHSSIIVKMNDKTESYFVLKKYSEKDALLLNMRTGGCYFCKGINEYLVVNEEHIKTNLFVNKCDEVLFSWDDVSLVDFLDIEKSLGINPRKNVVGE